jgi:hypothetical protein
MAYCQILAGRSGDAVNVAQQDRIAQREYTCPQCGAQPGKSCWEKARGNPGRKTYLARPHAERAELVPEEDGLALICRHARRARARHVNPGRLAASPHVALARSWRGLYQMDVHPSARHRTARCPGPLGC